MAEVIHNQALTGELTGAMRRSSEQAAAEPITAGAMAYTNLAGTGKAVSQHQAFGNDMQAMDRAVQEVAGKIAAVAATFIDLDRQRAKAMEVAK